MRLKRFAWSLVFAALAAFPFIAPASAHSLAYSHDVADCATGDHGLQGQYVVSRTAASGGGYKSVRGTATVTDLLPCFNANSSNGGLSLVNVVNARRHDSGTGGFMQFGYGKATCAAGADCTGGGMYNQLMDFWWTPADNIGGSVYAASWVDDLDGNTADHDYPIIGDKYRFTITAIASPNQWQFCIYVVSSSTYIVGRQDCQTAGRNAYYGFNEATWTIEAKSDASAIGHRVGSNSINLTPMQYMNTNGSIYTTVTGATCSWAGGYWSVDQIWIPIPWTPDGYACHVTGGTGTSSLDAWTNVHTN